MADIKYEKKIGKATAWSSVTELLVKLVTPLVNMVLARLLAPEAFGVLATINMVISFAEIFTDAGFQKYIVQHQFDSRQALDDSTNVAFWTNLSVSALACLIIYLFRHSIAALVGSPELGNSIAFASLIIILVAFSSIQTARYRRDMDFKTLFFVRVVSALIPVVVTIPLAVVLRNYWALLIGTFASNLFNAVVLTLRSRWRPRFYYNAALFREMFGFSMWTLLESISIWLTSYVGVFVVGTCLNSYYLGLYKTTMSTINSYMSIITAAIMPVLFSALSRYQDDDQTFRATFYRFQRFTAYLVVPMGAGIWLYSDLVTRILLGEQWMETSGFIGLWGLTSTLNIVFSHFGSELFRSKGNPKLSLLSQVLHILVLVPVLMLSVNKGFTTLYLARSVIRLHLALNAIVLMQRVYGFRFADTLKNIGPAFACTGIMVLAGWGMRSLGSSLLWQLLGVAVCVAVYFAALLGLFPAVRAELLAAPVVRKLLKRGTAGKTGK